MRPGRGQARRALARVTCAVALICHLAGPADAAQPVVERGEQAVPLRNYYFFDRADVAAADAGHYLVVWRTDDLIWARAFDPSGAARSDARIISVPARIREWPTGPRAAALPGGRFVVTWSEPDAAKRAQVLMARLVDADAAPLGPPVELGLADDVEPAVAADAAGVVTVAWTWTDRFAEEPERTFVRRLDGSRPDLPPVGWPAGPGVDVVDLGAGSLPSVALVPGGVVIARILSDETMAVVLLGLNGRPRGVERILHAPLPQDFENQLTVRVAADETGRFVVAWHELQRPAVDRLRAQRFDAAGTPVGEPIDLVTRPFDPEEPHRGLLLGDVESRRDGTLLVAWTDGWLSAFCSGGCSRYEEGGAVHASIFAADGTLLGDATAPPGDLTWGVQLELAGGAAAAGERWVFPYQGRSIEQAAVAFDPCDADADALCLADRFEVRVEWRTGESTRVGRPASMTADTGAFWFFSPSNVELVVKVLDGTAVNGKHWVFFASLTDVEFDLVVTDTLTGVERRYHNSRGTLASRADTDAFPAAGGSGAPPAAGSSATLAAPPPARAVAASTTEDCPSGALCLADGRFVVTAKWRLPDREGAATPIGWTGESGSFWFFSPGNVELLVKVLDGRAVNGHFWLFYASLSDVDFDLEVLDATSGQRRTYHNPRGTMASRADVDAF